jgi:hypothetical protein
MSWTAEAFRALKKIIFLEERMGRLADRVDGLGRLMTDMDRALTLMHPPPPHLLARSRVYSATSVESFSACSNCLSQ